MKIKISRSYSEKRQLRQYEPIDSFCSAEAEVEGSETGLKKEDLENTSELLDTFCRAEVKKTLDAIIPQKTEVKQNPAKSNIGFSWNDKMNYMERHGDGDGQYQRGERVDWDKDPKHADIGRETAEIEAEA